MWLVKGYRVIFFFSELDQTFPIRRLNLECFGEMVWGANNKVGGTSVCVSHISQSSWLHASCTCTFLASEVSREVLWGFAYFDEKKSLSILWTSVRNIPSSKSNLFLYESAIFRIPSIVMQLSYTFLKPQKCCVN